MKLFFHGAARTVIGTKHLLTLDNGKKYLLDCCMFQGLGAETDALNSEFGFDAKEVTCLFLSHAHIDHSGLIPKLVKEGFRGKIYSTQATKDLAEMLMCDSNAVLMSGYCQTSSLGGQLLNGARKVEIFGGACDVNSEIGQIKSLSAHGDSDDLCRFIGCQDAEKVQGVFLVHGEYLVQQELSARLNRKGFEKVEVPSMHQEFILD